MSRKKNQWFGISNIVGAAVLALSLAGAVSANVAKAESIPYYDEEAEATCRSAMADVEANNRYCHSLIGHASMESIFNCVDMVHVMADRANRVCIGSWAY